MKPLVPDNFPWHYDPDGYSLKFAKKFLVTDSRAVISFCFIFNRISFANKLC